MKLVLSRKGFDSCAGGCPSPILPDGRMISLPIPDKNSIVTYGDIRRHGQSIGPVVEQLTRGRIPQTHRAHLDPDLVEESLTRCSGWRPIFGQTNQAQTHLQRHEVGAGDLFLFFGLFRHTRRSDGQLTWELGGRSRHVIWGWLQVDEVLSPSQVDMDCYAWANSHPHFHRGDDPRNAIYIARKQLDLGSGIRGNVSGAGAFTHCLPVLQLTDEDGRNVSDWKLPTWFFPHGDKTPLTYHRNLDRWNSREGYTRLRAAARGQEFVLNCNEYPDAIGWLARLLVGSA